MTEDNKEPGKVLDFKKKMIEKLKQSGDEDVSNYSPEEQRYIHKVTAFADEIDLIIEKYFLDEYVEGIDVLGVLAHRMGHFMSHFDGKEKAYFAIDQIFKESAELVTKKGNKN